MFLEFIYKQKSVPEPVPDSFSGSSQTSLSSVGFARATPDLGCCFAHILEGKRFAFFVLYDLLEASDYN